MTLPVSTVTPERTFSSLKRIKIYLRYATVDDRLTGLVLLSVHRNIHVDPAEVINRLLNEKKKKFIICTITLDYILYYVP